jgi:hypothetical protein
MSEFLRGEEAKVDWNEQPFAVKSFQIRIQRGSFDVGNTEGKIGNPATPGGAGGAGAEGYEASIPTRRKATVTLREPTIDAAEVVFESPFMAGRIAYASIKIYPLGRGEDYHYFPSLQWDTHGHEAEAGQGQPLDHEGHTDGIFYLFGETKP